MCRGNYTDSAQNFCESKGMKLLEEKALVWIGAIWPTPTPYSTPSPYPTAWLLEVARGQTLGNKAWDVFYVGVMEDGIYRPEDYSTCYKLKKLGFKIYLDMTIPVKHNGMHGFQTTPEILKRVVNKKNKKK